MLLQEAWTKAQPIIQHKQQTSAFYRYQNNPVGFCSEVLGSAFTPEIQSVMNSVRDNPVTIARSCTGFGKTHGAAHVAIWWFLAFPDSKVFMTAAPPFENLTQLLWGELLKVVHRKRELFDGMRITGKSIVRREERNINKDDSIAFRDDKSSFIAGVAIPTSGTMAEREAKFSGKHAPFLLFIVDEGDAVPEEVYKGIEGCMSGGVARLLIMFNPRVQAGSVYMKERNHEANVVHLSAFNHPNVVSGQDLIPGAVTREATIRRLNEWTRPLAPGEKPGMESFDLPGFLAGQTGKALDGRLYDPLVAGYRKIENPAFSYMVLGTYPAQAEDQLIHSEWIEKAHQRWRLWVQTYGEQPPYQVKPTMGIDVAELGNDFNVACFRYGDFVARLKTWGGVDSDQTARKALELHRSYGCDITFVDATGVGSNVAPSMSRLGKKDKVRAVSVKVANSPTNFIQTELGEFYQLRDQLWWALREWLRTDPGAMLPPDPYLDDELKAPMYWVDNRGRVRVSDKKDLRELLRRSPDRAEALALTFSPFVKPKILALGYNRD